MFYKQYYFFLVHPQNEEQDGIISEWITSVISFPIKFKDEIAAIKVPIK